MSPQKAAKKSTRKTPTTKQVNRLAGTMRSARQPASKKKNQTRKSAKPVAVRIQRILVPVDFSQQSEKTLQYAVGFARQNRASLTLLHVVEPVIYPAEMGFAGAGGSLETMELNMQDTAKARLQEWVETHVPDDVPTRTHLRIGNPYLEITGVAKKIKADMIIISTHGYTGLMHVFLGSTAERVVRHATCPVLTVRQS